MTQYTKIMMTSLNSKNSMSVEDFFVQILNFEVKIYININQKQIAQPKGQSPKINKYWKIKM